MAKGYFIFTEDVHDADAMGAYAGKAIPTIMQSGGRPIIVDQNVDVVEGKWHGTQTVVLEFDSVEAAKGWYNSEAYQSIIGERHAAGESNAVVVAGFEMPG